MAALRQPVLVAQLLGQRAGDAAATLVVPFVPSDRNAPAARLFALPGFAKSEDGSEYRFELAPDRLPPAPEY